MTPRRRHALGSRICHDPTTIGDCLPGDRVVLDGQRVVVATIGLAGSAWVRDLADDGSEGEFRCVALDTRIEVEALR